MLFLDTGFKNMIQFFYEDSEESINKDYIKWLEDIIYSEQKKLGNINYIFGDDEFILKINQDYLQHDYYTDIITFDYDEDDTASVMTLKNAGDCIGCGACGRVCPKGCYSYAALPVQA